MSWSDYEYPSTELLAHQRTVCSIVTGFDLQPSSRVRISGDSPQEISEYLEFLGIDVISDVQKSSSQNSTKKSSKDETVLYPDLQEKIFDAVLVFFDTAMQRSLFDRQAFQTTALQLGSLRSNGHFVFALDLSGRVDEAHREECFVKHLSCFPGKISHGRPTNRFLSLNKRETPRYIFLSLQVPEKASYPHSWLEFVKPAIGIHQQSCCDFADSNTSSGKQWKQAA